MSPGVAGRSVMRVFCTQAAPDDSGLLQTLAERPYLSDSTDWADPSGSSTSGDRGVAIRVDVDDSRQRIDGFGASITQASAYLWRHRARDPDAMMRALFDPVQGIGLSMLRQPIGPSDHVTRPYSLLGRLPDRRLHGLDFRQEDAEILPAIHAAARYASGRGLRVIGSAWSAPWWMKTNGSVLGQWRAWPHVTGWLRPSCYGVYARYLSAFLRHYRAQGVDVFGVTPINEPDNPQWHWPSMAMTPRQQARFIARYLAPQLRADRLGDVRIMCWDHNYSTARYPRGSFVETLYAERGAKMATAGSAWHYYGGSPATMEEIHRRWPDKGIWVTEASGGDWGPRNWRAALLSMGGAIVDMLNHWAQSVVLWNIALDERGGPDYYYRREALGHSLNRGLLTVGADGTYRRNADYFALGHISKFVPPGSRVVDSQVVGSRTVDPWDSTDARAGAAGLRHVAFRTPDDERVLVLVNAGETARRLTIEERGRRWTVLLPPSSLNTALWRPDLSPGSVHWGE